MVDAAERLFVQAVLDGWDRTQGGLYYTVDADRPVVAERLHWPIAEAIVRYHEENGGYLARDDLANVHDVTLLDLTRAAPACRTLRPRRRGNKVSLISAANE